MGCADSQHKFELQHSCSGKHIYNTFLLLYFLLYLQYKDVIIF